MQDDNIQDILDVTDDYASQAESVKPLTVKELSRDEQPRERAKQYGISTLGNADLLAMILRTGVQGYPVTELCRDIMKFNSDSFHNLERCTADQLMCLKGVGELKAFQLMAVMEIVRRYNNEEIKELVSVRCSEDIYKLMRHTIGNLPHEEIWVLYLNRGNKVIGRMRVSSGGATATVFDLKKVLRNALHLRAEGMAMCHNHPSGTLVPSGADDAITRKLKEGCEKLELVLLDHLIITSNGYYSYQDRGRM